ncbi:MAG: hypothetical protein U0517_00980 [Candidatus Andersenbacteria bacterium]
MSLYTVPPEIIGSVLVERPELNIDTLLEAIRISTESSNVREDVPSSFVKRPVPTREALVEKLWQLDAEELGILCEVFAGDTLDVYIGMQGMTHEVLRARAIVERLREKRPGLSDRELKEIGLTNFESGVLRFHLGMVDGHDWPLQLVAGKFGKPIKVVQAAYSEAMHKLRCYVRHPPETEAEEDHVLPGYAAKITPTR